MPAASDEKKARATANSILCGTGRWSAVVIRPMPLRGDESLQADISPR
jgi:hypothetical protein